MTRTQTKAVRHAIGDDEKHGSVVPPIYLSTTYEFNGFKSPKAFEYSRVKNPSRNTLADVITELEGGVAGIVTSSGMSAILLVLQLLKPNDVLVIPHDCYGGSYRLFKHYAEKGLFTLIITDFTQTLSDAQFEEWKPTIVWLETPSNPLLRITDVKKVAAQAHRVGALVVADNTFLSPVLQQPLALGADIVIHSTTKYINGHSDVVGGAVVVKDAKLGETLAWWANCIGVTGSAFDCYLTLRGVRTLYARMRQHEENAHRIAEFLAQHEAISRVYYPGLIEHEHHDLAKTQQQGFGAMISFELDEQCQDIARFLDKLSLFSLAESLGGTESLICHPASMTHAAMDDAALMEAGISQQLIRISVGIEFIDDLIDDLSFALSPSASAARPSLW